MESISQCDMNNSNEGMVPDKTRVDSSDMNC
jgi:hypothetical protein